MPSVRLHAPPSAARRYAGDLPALARAIEERRDQSLFAAAAQAAAQELRAGPVAALDKALEELVAERARLADELPRAAVELALALARELLRHEVDAGHYDLEALVRETLGSAGADHGRCVVHLNPEDAAHLEGVRFRAGVHIEPDEGVGKGCVHVDTAQGLLVRDLREALEAAATKLREHTG